MRPIIKLFGNTFLYSCAFSKGRTVEEFVPEHLLAYQLSGQTQIWDHQGEMVLQEGQMLIGRRNQFAKSTKVPGPEKEYLCISIVLSTERLRKFAANNGIFCREKYNGNKNILLEPTNLLKDYFQSVLPYVQIGKDLNTRLANLKVNEALELILERWPDLKTYLFDFSEPYKLDLEAFMQKNFSYNAPIKYFAKMSGRSLTGFKRDFAATFKTSPAAWLKAKRLAEAYRLIKDNDQKPQNIYQDLGFENLSHFYTAFKQQYGHTPAQIGFKVHKLPG